MAWFNKRRERSWMQKACEAVITSGPVPKHVAIIMDGNRRYAAKNRIAKYEGHSKGFDKLAETLEWCLDLGIHEVTVYAFSIENFKRSSDEVGGLMELARQKFAKLLQEKDLINQHGVCFRILGDISLLPRDLQELLAEAVYVSANNTRATLNICFAYTARDDMCMAMREIALGVQRGEIKESDISENMIDKCLYTSHCKTVDLLIRTSGEVRLSDFLLWESAYSCLAFVKVLWPEFSIWYLYAVILHYQRNHSRIQAARQNNAMEQERLQRESDYNCVLEETRQTDTPLSSTESSYSMQQSVSRYAEQREARVTKFLEGIYDRRNQFIRSLVPKTPLIVSPEAVQLSSTVC